MINQEKARKIIEKLLSSKKDIPESTYRLQVNADFNFSSINQQIEYFSKLGIKYIYCSPYFQASPGSTHGYDVIDHSHINAEIGNMDDYIQMVNTLKFHNMGQIMDIVPNHTCMHYKNPIVRDILTHGQASRFAHFLDINWNPLKRELKGKILLPSLGNNFGTEVDKGNFKLIYEQGRFILCYYDNRFPIDPKTYAKILDITPIRHLYFVSDISEVNKDRIELEQLVYEFNTLPNREEGSLSSKMERYSRSEKLIARLHKLTKESEMINSHIQNILTLINGKGHRGASYDRLENIINEQVYRLSNWRVAAEEINYRRFFDINDLAAICMEKKDVFEFTHQLVFNLISEGYVQGLRVDHPDGLYLPYDYFVQLQTNYLKARFLKEANIDPSSTGYYDALEIFDSIIQQIDHSQLDSLFVIIEKILSEDEQIPKTWPISGTVGYEYLNLINDLFLDTTHEQDIIQLYWDIIGQVIPYKDLVYENKYKIINMNMWSEVSELSHRLNIISETSRHTRDFTLRQLLIVLRDVVACFPVYRTYIGSDDEVIHKRDISYIKHAISEAKKRNQQVSPLLFDFVEEVLLGRGIENVSEELLSLRQEFILRFQQLTAPIAAKGVEDTVFYIYNAMLSLNEVGGEPDRFGLSVEDFHKRIISYSKNWPYSLIATSTHDNKRSEDVRARLNVLSEIPEEWRNQVQLYIKLNAAYKKSISTMQSAELTPIPDPNTEYMIYQTLLGTYPMHIMDQDEQRNYLHRIHGFIEKSVREAKVYSNWINPDMTYENACKDFVENILTDDKAFLQEFLPFQRKIARLGLWNSLSQLLIKIGLPGIIDIYQGNELWNFSLVDPDNRRPVDYEKRHSMLNDLIKQEKQSESKLLSSLSESLDGDEQGWIKLYYTWKGLQLRKTNPLLFLNGKYIPLDTSGERSNHVIAFARSYYNDSLIVIASRFFHSLINTNEDLPIGEKWGKTMVYLPDEIKGDAFTLFGGQQTIKVRSRSGHRVILLGEALEQLPSVILKSI